jgi:nucleotide-binding universal stress UspA family protein
MTTSALQNPALSKIAFDRILVPIDFSDVSQRALEYAKSIAKLNDSLILLAHATEAINPITPAEVVWFGQLTVQQPEEEKLEAQGAELHSLGFRAKTVSLTGSIQEEILASADRENVDLIVLGTHGRTGVPRFLFGSEAEAMYRHAHCPIVVVGPAAKPVCAPAQAPFSVAEATWHPRDIICACDLDPSSAPTAAYAYRLAKEHGSKFTIFHVDDSEGKTSKEMQLLRFEKALAPLLIGDEKPFILWRTLLIGYGLGSTVADLAIERDSDLIVMGADTAPHAKTHFPRGIAPQVVAKAPCPVMILHQHGEPAF